MSTLSIDLARCSTNAAGIQARGLTKYYGDKRVVDDLSFSIQPGVVTGFLGPNGAGKSTTLRMLLGLVKPNAGGITIAGRHISALENPAHTLGAMLDARARHPHRTAFAHLLALAQAAGVSGDRVVEILHLVGLSDAALQQAGSFSLGMSQRLGIGAALLGDPDVLILDEPLNGLDPEGIRWMRGFLRSFAGKGRTVLFSSHLVSEMELTADRLIVIGQGRLIADSTLREFASAYTTEIVKVRAANLPKVAELLTRRGLQPKVVGASLHIGETDTATIGRIAAAEALPLEELTTIRTSLEDVFLRATQSLNEYESHKT